MFQLIYSITLIKIFNNEGKKMARSDFQAIF